MKIIKDDINKFLNKHVSIKNPKLLVIGISNYSEDNGNIKCIDFEKEVYKFNEDDNYYDAVIIADGFEYNKLFWLSFNEIVRVTNVGGFIYIAAPYKKAISSDDDCWRFIKDGFAGLAKWNGKCKLIDDYRIKRVNKDWVGVFKKHGG